MDKSTVTGLIVIAALLFGFSFYQSRQNAKFQEEKRIADSIALAQQRESGQLTDITERTQTEEQAFQNAVAAANTADSIRSMQLGPILASARDSQEQIYKVENDVMIVSFSNKGGKVVGVELKDYQKYSGGNIQMYAPNSAKFDLEFFMQRNFNNIEVHTDDYFFQTDVAPQSTIESDSLNISMKLYADSASYVEFLYTIYKDNYMMDFDVRFHNMQDLLLSNQPDMLFSWGTIAPQNEKGFQNENNATTISYKYPSDKSVENIGFSESSKQETVNSRLQWVAFKQQFFSSIFVADNNFLNAELDYDTYEPGNVNIKRYHASMAVEYDRDIDVYGFKFYYGPNKYSILKKYDISAQRIIPLGGNIIGIVNRAVVIPVFDWLEKTGMSYGLIILILTVIIKVIIFPLTYKSYLSTAKMRLLKPEMDQIAAKYPKQEDAMKRQQATMDLYKRAGVSPMGGCLPLLIQFPILIAMFRFFPASIELRGQSFLWADDLSSYDSILQLPFNIPFYGDHVSLFTLLMAISMHISARINYAQQPATNQPGMGGMKFMMLWLMPIMLLCWFNNYASGLSYYYLLSNIITMGQTVGVRYLVDDDKLHAKMKQNAAKKRPAKKKSKWQQRYEEMIKEQQRQQQNNAKRR